MCERPVRTGLGRVDASGTSAAARSRGRTAPDGSGAAGGHPLACASACASASSTTACSRTPSAAPSAGTASSAAELAAAGHEVTYLTRCQWEADDPPRSRACASSRCRAAEPLYDERGRRRDRPAAALRARRAAPPAGQPRPLRRDPHRRVPVLLAARGARRARRARRPDRRRLVRGLVARATGASTSAPVGRRDRPRGAARCACASPTAPTSSRACTPRACATRACAASAIRLSGLYAGPLASRADVDADAREPLAVFAGRHIPEKRAELVPGAVARARARGARAARARSSATARSARRCSTRSPPPALQDVRHRAGVRRGRGRRRTRCDRATCLVLPSSREGYGLVVIEAAAHGTPSVVVAGEDNAAAELVARRASTASSPPRPTSSPRRWSPCTRAATSCDGRRAPGSPSRRRR